MSDPKVTAYDEAVAKLEARDAVYRLVRDEHELAVRTRDVARQNFKAAQQRIVKIVGGYGLEHLLALRSAEDSLSDMGYEFALAADHLCDVEQRMEDAEIATLEAHRDLEKTVRES